MLGQGRFDLFLFVKDVMAGALPAAELVLAGIDVDVLAHDGCLHFKYIASATRNPNLRPPTSSLRAILKDRSPNDFPRKTQPGATRSRSAYRGARDDSRGRGIRENAGHYVSDRVSHRKRVRRCG